MAPLSEAFVSGNDVSLDPETWAAAAAAAALASVGPLKVASSPSSRKESMPPEVELGEFEEFQKAKRRTQEVADRIRREVLASRSGGFVAPALLRSKQTPAPANAPPSSRPSRLRISASTLNLNLTREANKPGCFRQSPSLSSRSLTQAQGGSRTGAVVSFSPEPEGAEEPKNSSAAASPQGKRGNQPSLPGLSLQAKGIALLDRRRPSGRAALSVRLRPEADLTEMKNQGPRPSSRKPLPGGDGSARSSKTAGGASQRQSFPRGVARKAPRPASAFLSAGRRGRGTGACDAILGERSRGSLPPPRSVLQEDPSSKKEAQADEGLPAVFPNEPTAPSEELPKILQGKTRRGQQSCSEATPPEKVDDEDARECPSEERRASSLPRRSRETATAAALRSSVVVGEGAKSERSSSSFISVWSQSSLSRVHSAAARHFSRVLAKVVLASPLKLKRSLSPSAETNRAEAEPLRTRRRRVRFSFCRS